MSYEIKQLSVFLENRPNELLAFTKILKKANISIKSIQLVDSADFGLVRSIVDNPQKAKDALHDAGFSVKMTSVFGVKIKDEIGSFNKILKVLAKNEINLLYTYSFYEEKSGIFIFCVDMKDFDKACNALVKKDFDIISATHFY
jgi:hypothetical protein